MKCLATQHEFAAPLSASELQQYASMEDDRVMAKLAQKLTPCDGANEVLAKLAQAGTLQLAVVSGSALRRVRLSLEKTGQSGFFASDAVFSASCSLEVPVSKPDPAIYLHALRALNRGPRECVAVEDSRSGVLSARRAGLLVLGYTGCYGDEGERERMGTALVEAGCTVVMKHWTEFEACLERAQKIADEA